MSLRELASADADAILALDGDSVVITPPKTLSYQWSVDGVAIPGATAASYAIPGTHGAAYTCLVTTTNLAGAVTETIAGVVTGNNVALASAPAAVPASWTLYGMYVRREALTEAEGIQIPGDESVIAVSLARLAALGLPDPELLRTLKPWGIVVAGVSYILGYPLLDRTIDLAPLILKRAA